MLQPKVMSKIIVFAPARGKLGLAFECSDGSSYRTSATVRTVRRLLADHGHSISAETLSAIAFCGHQCVFSLDSPLGRALTSKAPVKNTEGNHYL
jgi:hypothetical protein